MFREERTVGRERWEVLRDRHRLGKDGSATGADWTGRRPPAVNNPSAGSAGRRRRGLRFPVIIRVRPVLVFVAASAVLAGCAGQGAPGARPAVTVTVTAPATTVPAAAAASGSPATARTGPFVPPAPSVTAGVPSATVPAGQTLLTRTEVRVYSPWGPGGPAPGVRVTANARGSCNPSIAESSIPDAYRCFTDTPDATGATILDPCFVDRDRSSARLLCANSPTDTTATLLTADPAVSPPDPNSNGDNSDPWALDVVGVGICTHATGTVGEIGGKYAAYYCADGGSLYGDIDTSEQPWTAFHRAATGGGLLSVQIRTAWQ